MMNAGRSITGLRLACTVLLLLAAAATARAISLDKEDSIKLSLRTYTNVRLGTQDTDKLVNSIQDSQTFPFSAGGHVRQQRTFVDLEFDHDLKPLIARGTGPFRLFDHLPFKFKEISYHVEYRGEFDSVYDWGGKEYSTAEQFYTIPPNPVTGQQVDVPSERQRLRHVAATRNRLFQAYGEAEVGDLFARFGRQLLVWGETDGFRLLDNINPIDNGFGGFLIPLDERRMPLDMLRLQYFIGQIGPLSEVFVEAYGAIDTTVAYDPGIPNGSPWGVPNVNLPSPSNKAFRYDPSRTFKDARGGARLVFNALALDATFSVAQYWTYFDVPGVQVNVPPGFPYSFDPAMYPYAFSDNYQVHTTENAPKVMVSGATTTFALPKLYSVVRSEFAYFNDEPRWRQSTLDPFVFQYLDSNYQPIVDPAVRAQRTTGGLDRGDSVNFVLGYDMNQFIRFLNPNQSFFFTTQFFYRHLLNAAKRQPIPGYPVDEGEVIPVVAKLVVPTFFPGIPAEPMYAKQDTDQFLQTLTVSTSYRSGMVNPFVTLFYDWSGSLLFQPGFVLQRDPFRLVVDYSVIDAQTLKGNSGLSLYKDRDNVEFRIEYVL
jgi:hypothetical protein